MDLPGLTDLLQVLWAWYLDPMWVDGPPPIRVAGVVFWLFMAVFSWQWLRHRTAEADTKDAETALRLSLLGLRLLATALCLLLAADISGLAPAAELGAAVQKVMGFQITEVGGKPLTASGVVVIIAVVALTFWVSGLLTTLTTRALSERGVDMTGMIGVLINLGRYVVIVIGLAVGISTAGIDLTALLTLGAVFAVTIGFALQNIAQNFVSGIILLVEGAITPGDVLEVEGRVVRVSRMGIRSTVVRTMDDEDLILPNAVLAQGTVKNLTMQDDNIRVRASVSVAYDSDLERVRSILNRAADKVPDQAFGTLPVVLLQDFGDSGIAFDVFVYISDPWLGPKVRSELRFEIWRAFRDEGVVIPFPQVDLHMDPVRWAEGHKPAPKKA